MIVELGTVFSVRRSQAGFSLIEVTIAVALFVVLAMGAFEVVRQLVASVGALTARRVAYASAERFVAQLRAEARSATAIRIGADGSATAGGSQGSGTAGSTSGSDDRCVQVDFFTVNAAGPRFWSYRQFPHHAPSGSAAGDGASATAGAGGAVPGDVLERLTGTAPLGPCDPALRGEAVLHGLTAPLAVAGIPPGGLAAHVDAYSHEPDSPFVAASVPATAPVALDVLDASGLPIAGGNAVVEVRLDTDDASRVVDLLPGTLPGGFTEVLRYTCSERCDVGHDGPAPKTLTSCALSWRTAWSEYVRWNDYVTNADGTLTFPGGWFVAGTATFTYAGTRAADGGVDTLAKSYAATNWDAARDYAAYPPDRPAPDGSRAGGFLPWDVRDEPAAAWLDDLAPYLAAGELTPIFAERARCDAVQRAGDAGAFYANG